MTMRMGLPLILILASAACGDDTKPPARDTRPQREQAVAAEAGVDLGLPDLPAPDTARPPDQARPSEAAPPKEAGIGEGTPLPDGVKPGVGNDRCQKATAVTLVSGKATVNGTTVGLSDEFASVSCGGYTSFDGPQAYYKVDLSGGKSYRFALTPSFGAYLYLFSAAAGCAEGAIELDCASKGATGAVSSSIASGKTGELYFKAAASGSYYVAVDSSDPSTSGTFTLEIAEHTPPANGACAKPTPLTLVGGKATVTGSTAGVLDEFPGLKCGGYSTLDGPQVYYSLSIAAGKSFKLTLSPTFSAYLYIFSSSGGCNEGAIETYCASGGMTGAMMGSISSGTSKSLFFTPNVADTYLIAIDSTDPSALGSFTLSVEEFTPPTNGSCAKAKPLQLTAGKVAENGTTGGLKDEFPNLTCGGYSSFVGPQAYYTLPMSQGKGYKLTVTPTFSAYLYVFSSAAGCLESKIQTDCSSKGATGDRWGSISSSGPGTYVFIPDKSDTYTIAIDSSSASTFGDFKLEVEEFTPPANGLCAGAQSISMASGSATVTGSTAVGVKNQFANLKCGGSSTLTGPQLYYRLQLDAGKSYRFKLQPTFYASLYLFPDSAACQESAIETACASKGASGDLITVSSGSVKSLYYKPAATGSYVVAVDSTSATTSGDFTLGIDVIPTAGNGTCATAATVTLQNHLATVEGDTAGATNEFSTVKCGLTNPLLGPQLYYRLNMTAAVPYKLTLATAFDGYLVVFSGAATCQASAIDSDCASAGQTGHVLAVSNTQKTLVFTPKTTGAYYLAVESSDLKNGYYGYFKLDVKEVVPPVQPTFTAPFAWDFESDCKGLAATEDWECGKLAFKAGPNCDGSETPPSGGHAGGTGMWGTKLNDCYSPLGNNDSACSAVDTTDDSVLSFKVTIPAGWTSAELSYWSYLDVMVGFDWGELRIDGTPVKQLCKSGDAPEPAAWVQEKVSLTPYIGKTITVAFHFSASSVVNYSGWYLDDLAVSGQ